MKSHDIKITRTLAEDSYRFSVYCYRLEISTSCPSGEVRCVDAQHGIDPTFAGAARRAHLIQRKIERIHGHSDFRDSLPRLNTLKPV